jgi:hypothetical protein
MLILLSTTRAGADETEPPTRPSRELTEPKVHKVKDIHETAWACYTGDGFVELRHLITDYHTLWALLAKAEGQLVDYQHEVSLWKLRARGLKADIRAERRRGDEFKVMALTEHKLRLDGEQRHQRVRWIPWGLMIAQGVLYAGITVYGLANR